MQIFGWVVTVIKELSGLGFDRRVLLSAISQVSQSSGWKLSRYISPSLYLQYVCMFLCVGRNCEIIAVNNKRSRLTRSRRYRCAMGRRPFPHEYIKSYLNQHIFQIDSINLI